MAIASSQTGVPSQRCWQEMSEDPVLAQSGQWQLRQNGHQVGRQHRLVQVVEVRMLDHCLGGDAVHGIKQQCFL